MDYFKKCILSGIDKGLEVLYGNQNTTTKIEIEKAQ